MSLCRRQLGSNWHHFVAAQHSIVIGHATFVYVVWLLKEGWIVFWTKSQLRLDYRVPIGLSPGLSASKRVVWMHVVCISGVYSFWTWEGCQEILGVSTISQCPSSLRVFMAPNCHALGSSSSLSDGGVFTIFWDRERERSRGALLPPQAKSWVAWPGLYWNDNAMLISIFLAHIQSQLIVWRPPDLSWTTIYCQSSTLEQPVWLPLTLITPPPLSIKAGSCVSLDFTAGQFPPKLQFATAVLGQLDSLTSSHRSVTSNRVVSILLLVPKSQNFSPPRPICMHAILVLYRGGHPQLGTPEIAGSTGVTTHHLTWILNWGTGLSFE